MKILAGDIGGTKTRLAIVEHDADGVHVETERTLPSGEFGGLLEVIRASGLLGRTRFDAACFGVAGPVLDNRCQVTSLPWVVDGAELAEALGMAQVRIINDLEAVGWGLEHIPEDKLVCIHRGEPQPRGNQSIVAPGTGLGEAFRVWGGTRYLTFGSEGSHADFGPDNERECALLAWLSEKYEHVSWERLVSGPGLHAIHTYMVEREGRAALPGHAGTAARDDPSAAITAAARAGDAVCREAVHWFLGLLGAESGNHALKVMSRGGVFLAGGIPPKLSDFIDDSPFLQRFLDKGRMKRLMVQMPVYLVLDDRVPVYGAAVCAVAERGHRG